MLTVPPLKAVLVGWDGWEKGTDVRKGRLLNGGDFAFVSRALTSVNLIKAVCVRGSERQCVLSFLTACRHRAALSIVCPSSDGPRLTN